ncbi:class I SAM-dependent DNA methyltransferase [Desulforhopalus sp. 52FAK]
MVEIYDDYGDEPEDLFIPIPDHLSCSYYDLEMDDYTEDITFFDEQLPEQASILELGCGSGRVGRGLLNGKRRLTGIDISIPMLQKAVRYDVSPSARFVAMDMTKLAFNCTFDSLIIPYNSLNLLITQENISNCLHGCRGHLREGGLFVAQIFIPTHKFLTDKKKTFQFQIFDMAPGGRLIKEILKEYHPDSETITVEERFRYRPETKGESPTDHNSCYTVAAYNRETWLQLIKKEGFQILNTYEDLDKTPLNTTDASSLIVVCT